MRAKLRSRIGVPSPATVIALIALVVALSDVSGAKVPDHNGVITGCVSLETGLLRIIDTEAVPPQTCRTSEYGLSWNFKGDEGDQGDEGDEGDRGNRGPQGPQGQQGPPGVPG